MLKGKTARTRKASGKPKRRTAKKESIGQTYQDARKLLRNTRRMWAALGRDVDGLEALVRELPARQPLSGEAARAFGQLVVRIARDSTCEPIEDMV